MKRKQFLLAALGMIWFPSVLNSCIRKSIKKYKRERKEVIDKLIIEFKRKIEADNSKTRTITDFEKMVKMHSLLIGNGK